MLSQTPSEFFTPGQVVPPEAIVSEELPAEMGVAPGQTVDPNDIASEELIAHPLTQIPAQELADDEQFDPVEYAKQHFDALGQDTALLKHLVEVDRVRANRPFSAARFAKGVGEGAVETVKNAPRMAQSLASTTVNLIPGGSELISAAAGTSDDPEVATAMRREAQVTLGASLESQSQQTAADIGSAIQKFVVRPIAKKVQLSAEIARIAADKFDLPKVRTIANVLDTAAAGEDPEQWSDDRRVDEFLSKVALAQTIDESARGEGPIMADKLGVDMAELRQMGVEIDPAVVEDLGLITDVTEYIPAAKGFTAVVRGKALLSAPTKALAAQGVAKLRSAAAAATRKASKAAGAVGKIPPAVAGAAGAVVDGGTGAAGGFVLPRVAKLAESGLEAGAQMVEGTRKVPGAGFVSDVANAAPVRGAARGLAAPLSPELDNTIPLLAAAGQGTDEEMGQAVGSTAAFGALGGAAGGTVVAAKDAVKTGAEAVVAQRFAEIQREPVADIEYGRDPALDAAHKAQMGALRANDPKAANSLNWLRATALPEGSELYILPKDVFSAQVAASLGAPAGTVYDTPGFIETRPDGSTRVLLNETTTALGHEVGHAVVAAMSPETRANFLKEVRQAYGDKQIEKFGEFYDAQLGRQAGAESQLMGGNTDRIVNEIAAEMLTKALYAEPLTGVPPTLGQKIIGGLARFVEATSLYTPQVGRNPEQTKLASALGVTPSVAASNTAMQFLRDAQTDPNWMAGPRPPVLPPEAPAPTPAPAGGISRREFLTGGLAGASRRRDATTAAPTPAPAAPAAPAAPVSAPAQPAAPAPTPAATATPTPTAPPVTPAEATPAPEPPPLPATPTTPAAAPPVIPETAPATSAERLARLRQQTPPEQRPQNMRVTPEEQAALDTRKQVTGVADAEQAMQANPATYDDTAKKAFADINAALQRPQGEVAPVRLAYRSVVPSQGGAANARTRKGEQDAAYARERDLALQGLPSDVRALFDKVTIPYRWNVTGDNVNVFAMSLDKVLTNLRTVARRAEAAGAADLVPYATAAGNLTPEAARQFAADLRTYSANQANGYAGSGAAVTVPAGYQGDIPQQNPNYRPKTLDQRKADFINLLMGISPPLTNRVTADARARGSIPNVEAAKLAAANQRPVVQARTADPARNEYRVNPAVGVTAPTPITETNPLRDEFARRGVDLTGRNLFQVTENLNLQDIQSVTPAPESGFRAPAKDLIQAGFMPELSDEEATALARRTREGREPASEARPQGQGMTQRELEDWWNSDAPTPQPKASRPGSGMFMPEVDRDLVALHNTSERGLREALRLGGIPLPSLAVTRKDIPFSGYGNITLIAPRRVVDPEANPSNRVFAADAYTVRQPRPEVRPDGSRVIPGTEIPYTLENVAAYMERPDPRGQVPRNPDKPFPDVSALEELRTVREMRQRKSGLVREFDSDGDTTDRGYFEAKPQRPVRLSEFFGAVVPENTDPELVQQLRSLGLDVETYGGNPEQRREVVETVAERTGSSFMPSMAEYEARKNAEQTGPFVVRPTVRARSQVVDTRTGEVVGPKTGFSSSYQAGQEAKKRNEAVRVMSLAESAALRSSKRRGAATADEPKTPTGWVLPNGEYVGVPVDQRNIYANTGDFHGGVLVNRADEFKEKFGLKEADRLEALKKGFVRVRYDGQSGRLGIEALTSALNDPKRRRVVEDVIEQHSGKLSKIAVNGFNERGKVTLSDEARVVSGTPEEKVAAFRELLPSRAGAFMPAAPVDSEAFKKWIAGSYFVNPDGTPMRLYHGTDAGGFSVFSGDRRRAGFDAENTAFFTDAYRVARTYVRKSPTRPDEGVVVGLPEGRKLVANPELADQYGVRVVSENTDDFEGVALYIDGKREADFPTIQSSRQKTPFSDEELRSQAAGYLDSWGQSEAPTDQRGIYEVFVSIPPEEVLELDWKGQNWSQAPYSLEDNYGIDSTESAAEYGRENGFRAVVMRNVVDNGGGRGLSAPPATVIAVFRPGEDGVIKSADQNRGTFDKNNPDIRFMPDTRKMSDGTSVLTERHPLWDFARQSRPRDFKSGAPYVWYHGTDTEFDRYETPEDGLYGSVVYLTDTREDARTYGQRIVPVATNVAKPAALFAPVPEGLETRLRAIVPEAEPQSDGRGLYLDDFYAAAETPEQKNQLNAVLASAGYDALHANARSRGYYDAKDWLMPFKPDSVRRLSSGAAFMPRPDSPARRTRADIDPATLPPGQAADLSSWVSTRIPWAGGYKDDGYEKDLIVGTEDVFGYTPDAQSKLNESIKDIPGMGDLKGRFSDVVYQFRDRLVDNLLLLHDAMPGDFRTRAQLWYDGARVLAEKFAKQYGVRTDQAAAVLATLSPQMDWYVNVHLADMVLEAVTQQQNTRLPEASVEWVRRKLSAIPAETEKSIRKDWPEEKKAVKRANGVKAVQKLQKALSNIEGRTLAETAPEFRPFWVRAYSERNGKLRTPTVTPEGTILLNVTAGSTRWQNYGAIAKAIDSVNAPDRKRISQLVGKMHKVRNFYNNILLPSLPLDDVTVDTHAIAAALMLPYPSSADAVMVGLGDGGQDATSGSQGLYGVYADAYRIAAARRGIMARQMQSITWEALRGIYLPRLRAKKAPVRIAIEKLFRDRAKTGGDIAESIRQAIDIAGGFRLPGWFTGVNGYTKLADWQAGRTDAAEVDNTDESEEDDE